jgi:hypothetical protein
MTSAGMASHTGRSKLIAEDPVPVDILSARREIERQDRAFVAAELPSWPARRPRTGCWDTSSARGTESPAGDWAFRSVVF